MFFVLQKTFYILSRKVYLGLFLIFKQFLKMAYEKDLDYNYLRYYKKELVTLKVAAIILSLILMVLFYRLIPHKIIIEADEQFMRTFREI